MKNLLCSIMLILLVLTSCKESDSQDSSESSVTICGETYAEFPEDRRGETVDDRFEYQFSSGEKPTFTLNKLQTLDFTGFRINDGSGGNAWYITPTGSDLANSEDSVTFTFGTAPPNSNELDSSLTSLETCGKYYELAIFYKISSQYTNVVTAIQPYTED